MSAAVKRPQPKPVRVAPTVTDPHMRNSRGPAEMVLAEMGDSEEPNNDRDAIFGGTQKTKEEQETAPAESSQTSTMLIVVFALIVIALVALIVWMLMKQSNDKKDEDEVRRMIQPQAHPRNNMPPGYGLQQGQNGHRGQPGMQHPQQGGQPNMPQQGDPAYEAHQRNMAMMHQQQAAMQQQMAQMNAQMHNGQPGESDESQEQAQGKNKKKKNKSFAEVMAEKDGKVIPPLKEPLLDEEEPTKKPKFTKKHPHPGIMRPGGAETSDVDDVLAQTQAMLSKSSKKKASTGKPASKPASKESPQDLTELDKALLDKVHSNADDTTDDE